MKKQLRLSTVILLMLALNTSFAQDAFRFTTETDVVPADGFYKINLLPAIMAKCRPGLDDLRLLDSSGVQVPYIIKSGESRFVQQQFKPFIKMSETTDSNAGTKLVVSNNNGEAINNLVLVLKNSLADRSVNISGSNNAQHWYIIKEYINIETSNLLNEDHFVQSISIPLVAYKYFQITFNGKQHDPMFIEQAGTYKTVIGLKNYFTIPSPKILQKDSSNKYSYIQLISEENYKVSKLQVFASGTPFYQRTILFADGYYNSDKEQKAAILSAASDNVYFMHFLSGQYTTDTLRLRIQNNDNPALHIDSVKMYQDAYAIYAWLKAGQKYSLVFGNNTVAAPVYDLSAFADTLTTASILATDATIVTNHFTTTVTRPATSISKTWLWLIMAAVLGLLLFFTASLLKQLKKKEGTDA